MKFDYVSKKTQIEEFIIEAKKTGEISCIILLNKDEEELRALIEEEDAEGLVRIINIKSDEIKNLDEIKKMKPILRLKFVSENCSSEDVNQLISIWKANKNSVIIYAGAGSGKTTVMTECVYDTLIKGSAKPEEILLITHTRTGKKELEKRLYQLFNDRYRVVDNNKILECIENFININSLTIESYCKSILGEIGYYYGYSSNPSIVGLTSKVKNEIDNVITTVLNRNNVVFSDISLGSSNIKNIVINLIKDSSVNLYEIDRYAIWQTGDSEKIKKVEMIIKEIINEVVMSVDDMLIKEDKILLRQLNSKINPILEHYPISKESLKKIKYIYIDEGQDTSYEKMILLKALARITNANIIFCGDEHQSIFRFIGAYQDVVKNFQQEIKRVVKLTTNYRSKKEIVDYSNILGIKFFPKSYRVANVGRNDSDGGKVKVINCNDLNIQVEKIYDILRNKQNENIMILVRTNRSAIKVYNMLKGKGINLAIDKGGDLYRVRAARELLLLIKYLLMPDCFEIICQLFNTKYLNLDHSINGELLIKSNMKYYSELLSEFDEALGRLKGETDFQKLLEVIDLCRIKYTASDYYDDLNLIIDEMLKNNCTASFYTMKRFLESMMRNNYVEKNSLQRTMEKGIIIRTMHSAKGTEASLVIILADYDYSIKDNLKKNRVETFVDSKTIALRVGQVMENLYFKQLRCNEQKELEMDEKKLLYVSVTRARDELYILRNTMKNNIGSLLVEV